MVRGLSRVNVIVICLMEAQTAQWPLPLLWTYWFYSPILLLLLLLLDLRPLQQLLQQLEHRLQHHQVQLLLLPLQTPGTAGTTGPQSNQSGTLQSKMLQVIQKSTRINQVPQLLLYQWLPKTQIATTSRLAVWMQRSSSARGAPIKDLVKGGRYWELEEKWDWGKNQSRKQGRRESQLGTKKATYKDKREPWQTPKNKKYPKCPAS